MFAPRLRSICGLPVALCLGAGCFSPTPVSVETLEPKASHFAWVVLGEEGELLRAELVAATQEAPVLRRRGERLFVFPVPSEWLLAQGVVLAQVPARSALRLADVCAPRLEPREVYEWREDALVAASTALPPLSGDVLRVCASEPPRLSFLGPAGLFCEAEPERFEACEWSLRFAPDCALPADRREWRLRSWGAGGGCARPVGEEACTVAHDLARRVTRTECPGELRAVVASPVERLEAQLVSLPGVSAPPYSTPPLAPQAVSPLALRSGFVTGLVRLPSGALVVAVSTALSEPRGWNLSARTILHLVDPDTLEVRSSSPPLELLSFGLSPDGDSSDTVLLAVAGPDRRRVRLLRVTLAGELRAATDLPAPLIRQQGADHLRYVGTWRSAREGALVTAISGQLGDAAEPTARSLTIGILDPLTLELVRSSTPTTLGASAGVYARYGWLTNDGEDEQLTVVNEIGDRIDFFSLGGPGQPIERVDSLESTIGGLAHPLHVSELRPDAGGRQFVVSVSGRQRSWRNLRDWSALTVYAAGGPPSLTAPIAPGLLLAPEFDEASGDLRLLLLDAERMELMPAHAPILRGVGPPGLELHHEGTVWLAFAWTGRLARVRLSSD